MSSVSLVQAVACLDDVASWPVCSRYDSGSSLETILRLHTDCLVWLEGTERFGMVVVVGFLLVAQFVKGLRNIVFD